MEYIVDIQGFRLPINEFIIKELAILPVNDNNESARPFNFLFQPPCEWTSISSKYRNINRWLENNLHGITWTSGNVPYTLLKIILTKIFKNATKIYVKGLEKKNFLKCFVKKSIKIIDLYELKCPPLQYLINESKGSIKCFHHNKNIQNFDCALRNVILLKLWLHKNYKIESKNNNNICQLI